VYGDDEAAEMLRVAVDAYSGRAEAWWTRCSPPSAPSSSSTPEFRDWGLPELEHLERNANLFRKRLNE
jgi:hypothetical protein